MLGNNLRMSCVAGLADDGVVYMAAETAAFVGDIVILEKPPKIFTYEWSRGIAEQSEKHLIGAVGSFRFIQIVEHYFKIPFDAPKRDTAMQHMVMNFIPALRHVANEHHYLDTEGDIKAGTLLVGYDGHLFDVHTDFLISEPTFGYDVIGHPTACAIALGALHALRDQGGIFAGYIVEQAIRAASAQCTYADGPIRFGKLDGRQE